MRAGGMADVGIAVSPDANSIFWNAAKLVFIDDEHPQESPLRIRSGWKPGKMIFIWFISPAIGKWIKPQHSVHPCVIFRWEPSPYWCIGKYSPDFRPNEFGLRCGLFAQAGWQFLSAGLDLKYIYSNLASGRWTAFRLNLPTMLLPISLFIL